MGRKQRGIDSYDIVRICLAVCFVISLKVWDSTKSLGLSTLAFFAPLLLYLIVKGIQRYQRRKVLLESGIHVIDTMSGEEFEELLLTHYINLGYTGKLTPETGDYGADLVLEKDNQRIVVQAKRWKSVVGIEAVQQIIGAIKYYGAAKGMVITNSVFTENACELARVNSIELIDRKGLIEIMRQSQGKDIAMRHPERTENEPDNALGILPDEKCPLCSRTLVRRKGKYGSFIGCSGFPVCRFTRQL